MLLRSWFADTGQDLVSPWTVPFPLGVALRAVGRHHDVAPALLWEADIDPPVTDDVIVCRRPGELGPSSVALAVASEPAGIERIAAELAEGGDAPTVVWPALSLDMADRDVMAMDFPSSDDSDCRLTQTTVEPDGALRTSVCVVKALPRSTCIRVASATFAAVSEPADALVEPGAQEVRIGEIATVRLHRIRPRRRTHAR